MKKYVFFLSVILSVGSLLPFAYTFKNSTQDYVEVKARIANKPLGYPLMLEKESSQSITLPAPISYIWATPFGGQSTQTLSLEGDLLFADHDFELFQEGGTLKIRIVK